MPAVAAGYIEFDVHVGLVSHIQRPLRRTMLASPLLRQAPASCALQAVATQPPCTASAIIARSTRRGCAPVCASARSAAPVVLSAAAPPQLPYRVGHGFDLHRLAPGLRLVLGGVDVPSEKGCEAHSDGACAGSMVCSSREAPLAWVSE